MDRKLADYLTPYIRQYKEFIALTNTEQMELERLEQHMTSILQNAYIQTADEIGLKRYESIIGIIPEESDTLEDRRFRILTRWTEQLPYTYRVLEQRLSQLCGKNGFILEIEHQKYQINIKIQLYSKNRLEEVKETVKRMIPANMLLNVELKYNTWKDVKKIKWKELKQCQWKDVREVVISG